MSRIRGRDTAPERQVRSLLHHQGFRFTLRRQDLPGKPDIVLPRWRTVVFVHGCFWHRHEGCINAVMPKTRTTFWQRKLRGNVIRDEANLHRLEALGWSVIIVWECELSDKERLLKRLVNAVEANAR